MLSKCSRTPQQIAGLLVSLLASMAGLIVWLSSGRRGCFHGIQLAKLTRVALTASENHRLRPTRARFQPQTSHHKQCMSLTSIRRPCTILAVLSIRKNENNIDFRAQKWDPKNNARMHPSLMSFTVGVHVMLKIYTSMLGAIHL